MSTPTALFDLGNTLVRMGHADYVRGVAPNVLRGYEEGNPAAGIEYEHLVLEGLRNGQMSLNLLPGVEETLRDLQDKGMKNAVYSTCLAEAIEIALELLNIRGLMTAGSGNGIYSSFQVNGKEPLDIKAVSGFEAVNRSCSGGVRIFADDKIAEVRRAREGLGRKVSLYLVGTQSVVENGIVVVQSIADIK